MGSLGPYRIEIATDFGPRVIGLGRYGEPDVLARLSADERIDLGEGRSFLFRGGHRLWVAPEIADVTYSPDAHHCEVFDNGRTIRVAAPVDDAGFRKEIELSDDGDAIRVDHRLLRDSGAMIVAAWAITQLPLGGTAIMALPREDTAPQADRNLVLWPYTSLIDRRITWRDDAIVVVADEGPPLKLGAGPGGRLGYLRDGTLFIKESATMPGGEHPDLGAAAQVFVGQAFCELETTGPLRAIGEGDLAAHTEIWRIVACGDLETAVALTLGTAA